MVLEVTHAAKEVAVRAQGERHAGGSGDLTQHFGPLEARLSPNPRMAAKLGRLERVRGRRWPGPEVR